MSFPAFPEDDALSAAISAPMESMGAPPPMMDPALAPIPGVDDIPVQEPLVEEMPPGWTMPEIHAKQDLRVPLSEDKRLEIGQWLTNQLYQFKQTWQDRLDNAQGWRDAASMMPNWPIVDPRGGDGAETLWMSRCRFPGTAIGCLSQVQSLIQQLLVPNPTFTPIPLQVMWSPDDGVTQFNLVEEAGTVAAAMQSLLDRCDFKKRCSDLFREIVQVCPAAIHVKRDYRSLWVMDLTVGQDEAALVGNLEAGVLSPMESYMDATDTNKDGSPRVKRSWKEEVLMDGTAWEIIPAESFIRLPPMAKHEEKCWAMGDLGTISARELYEYRDNPLSGFYREEIDHLLGLPSDDLTSLEWVQDQDDREGASRMGASTGDDREEYKEWWRVDLELRGHLDGDKKREKRYVVTVHPSSGRLLRCVYVSDGHAHCNYVPVNYMGSKLVGMSLAEINSVLQDSADKILGDLHDLLSIAVGQGGSAFVEESAVPNGDAWTFVPGRFFPVTNINGILPMKLADNIPAVVQQGLALLMQVWDYQQKVMAISNVTLGQESDRDQTATEATMLFRQDASIRETNALGVAMQLGKAVEITAKNEAQYCKDQIYKWTEKGESGVEQREMDPRLFGAPWQWIPAGMTASSSPAVRFQKAMTVMNIVQSDPLLSAVEAIHWEQLAEVLQSAGVQDWKNWIAQAKQFQEQMRMAEAVAAEEAALAGEEAAVAGDELGAAQAALGTEALNQMQPASGGAAKKNGAPPPNEKANALMGMVGAAPSKAQPPKRGVFDG